MPGPPRGKSAGPRRRESAGCRGACPAPVPRPRRRSAFRPARTSPRVVEPVSGQDDRIARPGGKQNELRRVRADVRGQDPLSVGRQLPTHTRAQANRGRAVGPAQVDRVASPPPSPDSLRRIFFPSGEMSVTIARSSHESSRSCASPGRQRQGPEAEVVVGEQDPPVPRDVVQRQAGRRPLATSRSLPKARWPEGRAWRRSSPP